MIKYEKYTSISGGDFVRRENEDGSFSDIPMVAGNADYEAYLNPVEHLTEIIPADEAKTK